MIVNNRIIPGNIAPVSGTGYKPVETQKSSSVNFEDILKKQMYEASDVKFSKHAQSRLETRNIDLTEEQKLKLNESVNKANDKSVKDSLVLVDDIAFVVNIENKTVVTVMNKDEMKNNVFLNIDGAVIA